MGLKPSPIWGYHWGYHIIVSFRGLYSPKISDSANVVPGKLAHIAVAITTPAADYASISWTARWLNSFNRVKWEWNSNHFTTSLGSTLTGSLGSRILCCGPYAKTVPLIPSITSPELRGSPFLLQPGNIKHHWQTPSFLVGGIPTPLKNMSSSVGMILPNIWKNKSHVPNHQPDLKPAVFCYGKLPTFLACFWWLQPAPEAPRPPNIFNHRLGHDLEDLLLGRFPMFFLLEHPISIYIYGDGIMYIIYIYVFIYLYVCSFIYLYVIYIIYAPSNPKNLPTFPLAIHRLPLQRLPCALLRDLHGKYAIEAKLIVGPAVVHLPILGHRRSARPKSGFQPLPSGNFTYWKCTIYSWFTYSKWWFSIAKC